MNVMAERMPATPGRLFDMHDSYAREDASYAKEDWGSATPEKCQQDNNGCHSHAIDDISYARESSKTALGNILGRDSKHQDA